MIFSILMLSSDLFVQQVCHVLSNKLLHLFNEINVKYVFRKLRMILNEQKHFH